MRQIRLIAISLLVLLLVACSADEWETYQNRGQKEAEFAVAVPQGAERQLPAEATATVAGKEIPLRVNTFHHEGEAYTILHGNLQDEPDSPDEIEAILDDIQRWFESEYNPSDLRAAALSWNGYPGRALRFQIPFEESAGRGRSHILLVEDELYLLIATGPEDAVAEWADRFLASFTIRED